MQQTTDFVICMYCCAKIDFMFVCMFVTKELKVYAVLYIRGEESSAQAIVPLATSIGRVSKHSTFMTRFIIIILFIYYIII